MSIYCKSSVKYLSFLFVIGSLIFALIYGIINIILSNHEARCFSLDNYIVVHNYTAEKDEFLGRKGTEAKDIMGGVYSLKDLSVEDYVLHEQWYTVGHSSPSINIYINKNCEEPILRYETYKFTVNLNGKDITIEDKDVINDLLSVLRSDVAQETTSPYHLNTTLYFDLECNLSWHCNIAYNSQNKLIFTYFDVSKNNWYCCSVDEILADFFNK